MTDLRRLIVASQNPGKAARLPRCCPGLPAQVLSLKDFPGVSLPEETGVTFAENATLKARAVSQATGEWALADDSGLVVPALGGAPGLHSAGWPTATPGVSPGCWSRWEVESRMSNVESGDGRRTSSARWC